MWPEHRGEEVGGPDVDKAGGADHARQGLLTVKSLHWFQGGQLVCWRALAAVHYHGHSGCCEGNHCEEGDVGRRGRGWRGKERGLGWGWMEHDSWREQLRRMT